MRKRRWLLVVLGVAVLGACGPPPKTEAEICGAQGCDACIGLACAGYAVNADAGVDGGH